jgi:threonine dehydrogenase-like Zn-dependent dehydrogenase
MSAIQLAQVMGAAQVLAVDIDPERLAVAETLGATPIDGKGDTVGLVRRASGGGVDVAIELVGSAGLMGAAVAMLAPSGRAVAVGITDSEFGLDPYRDLVTREAELLGASDHLASEVDEVLGYAATGAIDIERLITGTVPLEATAVNGAMDRLEAFGPGIRTVITPQGS